MSPRVYLAALLGLAGLILGGLAGLNLAMDPWGVDEGASWRLRPPGWTQAADRLPDHGLAGRRAAARLGRVPVLLVGTSRTMHGFAPAPGRLNAGLTNGTLEEARSIVRAAAASDAPPRLVLVEAAAMMDLPAGRRALAVKGPTIWQRLFGPASTLTALDLARRPTGEPYVFDRSPAAEALRRDQSRVALALHGHGGAGPWIREAGVEWRALCRATGMQVVVVEPPIGPRLRRDPHVVAATKARVAAYRAGLAAAPPGPCRPVLIDLSGMPVDDLGEQAWLDNVHFAPVVGERMLGRIGAL